MGKGYWGLLQLNSLCYRDLIDLDQVPYNNQSNTIANHSHLHYDAQIVKTIHTFGVFRYASW